MEWLIECGNEYADYIGFFDSYYISVSDFKELTTQTYSRDGKMSQGEKKKVEVGEIISFELKDGEEVEAMAVKQDGDNMIFCLVDYLNKGYQMNSTDTNEGGWEASELCQKLNSEILDKFPEDIRSRMVPFSNGDFLRIPMEKEMLGENKLGEIESEDVQQWEPMKIRRNRICFKGKDGFEDGGAWLQDPFSFGPLIGFVFATSNGLTHFNAATSFLGVRLVFQIRN